MRSAVIDDFVAGYSSATSLAKLRSHQAKYDPANQNPTAEIISQCEEFFTGENPLETREHTLGFIVGAARYWTGPFSLITFAGRITTRAIELSFEREDDIEP